MAGPVIAASRPNIQAEQLRRRINHPDCGAVCAFDGVVRDNHRGKTVTGIIYEAYHEMAEEEAGRILAELRAKWPMCRIAFRHRIGEIAVGESAVAIVVWAPHRREAFAVCAEAIDLIKRRVPIWKREFYADGTEAWGDCRHDCGHGAAPEEIPARTGVV